jgi:hypothetical protein
MFSDNGGPSRAEQLDYMLSATQIKLQNTERKLADAEQHVQRMAEELHAAINEPMYAGTRRDWMQRAQKAETLLEIAVGALENILTADPTSTWETLLAVARKGLGK